MSELAFCSGIGNKLRNHEKVCASWIQSGSAVNAEILAEAGFDMVVIDMEHSQTTLPGLVSMLQAMKGTGCFSMVRVPWNDKVWMKHVLDCGVEGIHVPYVSTREEAEQAVSFCKYPSQGVRGIAGSQRAVCYGQKKDEYYNRANKDGIVMIAIETLQGVENIDEIVNVEGVDGIFIGPADLSTSMGYLNNPEEPHVQEAIAKIEKCVFASSKFLGTVAANMNDAKVKYNKGYDLLYLMSDVVGLMNISKQVVSSFQEYKKGK
ncbi:MAG: aldolase/citrate lyase family protein [Eubacteriales bacterium]